METIIQKQARLIKERGWDTRCNGKRVRLYRTGRNMKQRCTCPNNIGYHRYGGRGITVCLDWMADYGNFRAWAVANGYSKELSIDRIDNDGNYEPSNCRWATRSEQAKNRIERPRNPDGTYQGGSV